MPPKRKTSVSVGRDCLSKILTNPELHSIKNANILNKIESALLANQEAGQKCF